MLDKTLVERKISLISEDLRILKSISLLSEKDYFKTPSWEIQTERYFERIIGRMLDINYHLITESGMAPPPDYFQSFTKLEKLKILPPQFSRKIASLAGLRNRLAHEYNSLDEKKIYRATKTATRDIPKYLEFIDKFINK